MYIFFSNSLAASRRHGPNGPVVIRDELALPASLNTIIDAGKRYRMATLRKITVQVPADDLAMAQAFTGEGVSETVRAGLKKLASIQAQHDLLKLRGTFKFTIDLDQLREDRT